METINSKPGLTELIDYGFASVGSWTSDLQGSGIEYVGTEVKNEKLIYAFVTGSEIMYIGKCKRFTRRMSQYKTAEQRKDRYTNKRVFEGIRESLIAGSKVQIFVLFPEVSPIPKINDLPIDLVDGLETPFIDKFDPNWNKKSVTVSPEEQKLFRAAKSRNRAKLFDLGLNEDQADAWIEGVADAVERNSLSDSV